MRSLQIITMASNFYFKNAFNVNRMDVDVDVNKKMRGVQE